MSVKDMGVKVTDVAVVSLVRVPLKMIGKEGESWAEKKFPPGWKRAVRQRFVHVQLG